MTGQTPENGPQSAAEALGGPQSRTSPPEAASGPLEAAEPYDGPTVAECAANDRRWPLEKYGE